MFYGEVTVQIGVWHERESRDERRCPSYYAADWEVLRTQPGDYPLSLTFIGGYVIPMPYWLSASVDAERVDGRVYSGFGGVNFASDELPKGPAPLHRQLSVSSLKQLVAEGRVTVLPQFAGLVADHAAQIEWARGKDYAAIRQLAEG